MGMLGYFGDPSGSGKETHYHQYNTGLEFLRYGAFFWPEGGKIEFESEDEEIGLVCLGGNGSIQAEEKPILLAGTMPSTPEGDTVHVTSKSPFDLAECAAPSTQAYPVQHVRFEEVLRDPDLVRKAGFEPYARTLHTVIGEKNVRASVSWPGSPLARMEIGRAGPPRSFEREGGDLPLHRHASTELRHPPELYRL